MIKQISDNVWQFYFNNLGSNCYLVKIDGRNILIDTSGEENKQEFVSDLNKIKIKPQDIDIILLTHLHYDHVGNLDLFKNAKVYASEKEISYFYKNSIDTMLAEISENKLKLIKAMLKPISKFRNKFFKVIETPGHTRGSLAFYLPKEKILFSGDTLFEEGIGRTDLPTSNPEEMSKSLRKLSKIDYKILCAGH
jgi:glyoxylase-like metal-dependent hydrolase (beta-lactamase superfamily II)